MFLLQVLCNVLWLSRTVESFTVVVTRRQCVGGSRFERTRVHAANGDDDGPVASLLRLLQPAPDCRVEQMSSTDLAYIGDAVYELLVRSKFVWPSKRTSDLQNRVVGLVRAEHHSQLLARLRDGFALTATEQQVLARGRNASSGGSRTRRNPTAYQDSTALEALIGYIFITDVRRCHELLQWIQTNLDEA